MRRAIGALAAVVAATPTCVPKLANDDSLITAPRILAVKAEPAEAAPGTKVTFTALVAAPGGTVATPALSWSFCTAPKPLTEDNVVSNACLDASSLAGAGAGTPITTQTPSTGCGLFGPDTTSSAFRPRDPDSTGGFYQPLRVDLAGADSAFELARIHCDLPDADAAAASAFSSAYALNRNPTLLGLTAGAGGAAVSLGSVPAGTKVTLEASWPAASAETFAYFDPVSQSVGWQREAMQVAWYASAGALDTESTGRGEEDPATTSDNGWVAPGAAGTVHRWVVLRDSRGGVDFEEVEVGVE
ncbi:MAG TPA: hypothetical protein VIF09_08045 [Polyangiaceae bacterium]